MKIDKSEFRVRPGFLLFLFAVFILCPWIASILLPAGNGKKKTQIIFTRLETKKIASVLYERATTTGSLSNIDNNFILQAIFGTNTLRYSYRTNADGEIHDLWETSYKIDILGQTNFVIRSAGPDKLFGDKDDIIFNSISNDFVKP